MKKAFITQESHRFWNSGNFLNILAGKSSIDFALSLCATQKPAKKEIIMTDFLTKHLVKSADSVA